MSWQNVWKLARSDYIKLMPILALAFYMAFIPNLNYPYAVHIDEWVHIAHSNELLSAGNIYYPDPFSGQPISGEQKIIATLELGYHLPLAVFQRLSGISWMDIARYFPSIIFVFTVLSVYIFAKRMGFGWEAAFFTTLIPTTVGIMGPAFMVPMAMGLIFVPLLLFLVFNYKTPWSYLALCISIGFLMILHAPSAILMVIILVPFILIGLRGDLKHSLFIILAVTLPLLVTLPWTLNLILSQAGRLFVPEPLSPYHLLPRVIPEYGYLPIASCLLGTFVLAIRGGKENYSLVIGLLLLLIMLSTFYTLDYGIAMLYRRALPFAMLVMSIVAGAGLMTLRKLEIPWLANLKSKKPLVMQTAGTLLCLIFLGATLAIAVPDRQATLYYYMIDKTDYEAFVWIKNNVDTSNQKAILDPWKATAFTAITEKYVHTRIHVAPQPIDNQTYDFLRSGSTDTAFLRKNGISIIYTRVYDGNRTVEYDSNNPDLVEVRKNIYMLKEIER